MLIAKTIYITFIISLGYFLILTIYYIFLALIGSIEEGKRASQGEKEDYSLFYLSPLKIPVSIIMPLMFVLFLFLHTSDNALNRLSQGLQKP